MSRARCLSHFVLVAIEKSEQFVSVLSELFYGMTAVTWFELRLSTLLESTAVVT